MSHGWLDILQGSGDANLGQTLVRLARLAASAHQYEAAMQMRGLDRKEQDRAEGLGPGLVVDQLEEADPSTGAIRGDKPGRAGAIHREVDR